MDVPLEDVVRQVRRAYNDLEYPPSARTAADYGPYDRHRLDYRNGAGVPWAAIHAAAGVPTVREVVVDELRERYRDRYEWDGDAIRVKSYAIAEATGIDSRRIGQFFAEVVDGEVEQPNEFVIERGETERHGMWIVRGREGGEGA
ncbi:hypothetical protein C449_15898 [Halococcus saccharolyticus DSM 5350]|uniref:Uncharacterized protein n=2 Tax=Halococcus saccharolyticus TaxID=62319 RepID=M0ME07_9EURY|nr:hypothetical protein C449_15898 [Halococcus saccharolyticus DSM 5350]